MFRGRDGGGGVSGLADQPALALIQEFGWGGSRPEILESEYEGLLYNLLFIALCCQKCKMSWTWTSQTMQTSNLKCLHVLGNCWNHDSFRKLLGSGGLDHWECLLSCVRHQGIRCRPENQKSDSKFSSLFFFSWKNRALKHIPAIRVPGPLCWVLNGAR